MAQISVQPLYLKDVVLTVGTDGYEKHVSGVTITPTNASATFKGLNPDAVYTESGAPTWICQLQYVQDWDTADSLSAYLFENQGTDVTLSFQPVNGSGGTWSMTVHILPGAVGGAVDSFATTTVDLPVQGQPTFTPGV